MSLLLIEQLFICLSLVFLPEPATAQDMRALPAAEELTRDAGFYLVSTTLLALLAGIGIHFLCRRGARRENTDIQPGPNELRYMTVFEDNPDAVFVADPQSKRIINCNKQAEKLSGYSKAELLEMSAEQLHPVDTLFKTMAAFKKQADGVSSTIETELLTKNRRRVPVAITTAMIRFGQTSWLLGIFRNIAAQKDAEKELRLSEEKFRVLYESSHDAIMTVLPPDWHFSDANPATIKLFKAATLADFLSKTPAELSPKYQPDGTSSGELARKMIDTALRNGSHYFEWDHQRLDGEVFKASVLLTRLEFSGKIGVQATVRDISSAKREEQQRTEYTSRLEKQRTAMLQIMEKTAAPSHLSAEAVVRTITEASAHALSTARTSLWMEDVTKDSLYCRDLYESAENRHSSDHVLRRPDYPAYFKALHSSLYINADDALTDARTKEFSEHYLKPRGITSMLDVPIKLDENVLGVLCFEHVGQPRRWHADEIQFATTAAAHFALALARERRLQAEEDLYHEKERLLITLRSIGDGVIVTDAHCRIAMMNPTAEKLTGWDESAAKHMELPEVFRIINERTQQPCENPAQKAIRTNSVISLANHTVLIAKDGARRDIADSGAPIKNAQGEIIGVVLVFRDVTEAHSIRDRLQLNTSAVDSAISGIFLFNLDGVITYANRAFSDMCGYESPSEVQGKHVLQFLAGEVVLENVLSDSFSGAWSGELRGYARSGEMFYAHVSISSVKTEESESSYLMGSAIDITEQKENSNQLLAQNMEMLELNHASNAIVKMTKRQDVYDNVCTYAAAIGGVDLVWMDMIDEDGKTFVPVCSSGKLPNQPSDQGVRFHNESIPTPMAQQAVANNRHVLLSTLNGRSPFPEWERVALAIGIKSALMVPITLKSGRVAGVLSLLSCNSGHFTMQQTEIFEIYCNQIATALENVTLLESLEKKIEERTIELRAQKAAAEQARQIAESANKAKSTFLANMSHELRTPLNVVISSSDILRQEMFGPVNDRQKEYLDYVKQSAQHLLSLINDILDLSKVESGKMELSPSEFSLRDLLDSVVHMLLEPGMRANIELDLEISPEADITVEADQRKLKQIVFNLLGNAVKFSNSGGRIEIAASITDKTAQFPENVRCKLSDGRQYFVVAITDQGIGIKESDLGKLFQPFMQLEQDNTRERQGTGLGLDLTKKLIEMHKGAIWVRSEFGKGSTFTFAIPVRQHDAKNTEAKA